MLYDGKEDPICDDFRASRRVDSLQGLGRNATVKKRQLAALCAALITAATGAAQASQTAQRPLVSYKSGETVLEPSPDSPRVFTLLISPFAQPNVQFRLLERTIDALAGIFGRENLRVRISSGEPEDFARGDMVICSSGTYLRMIGTNAQALATAVSDKIPDPNQAEGSLFVTLKKRGDINGLADLAGKTVAVTGPNAFSYSIALSELAAEGYDPDSFFGAVFPTAYDMRATLRQLRLGTADSAVVRTCFLEELAAAGEDISDIKPVSLKPVSQMNGCMSSTELYPNWTFLATASLEPRYAREVAKALLSMPAGKDGQQWSIASDFSATDAMYRSIRRGPYEYLRDRSLKQLWSEYWHWFAWFVAALVLLAAHTLRTRQLLEARTRELRRSEEAQRELQKRTFAAQSRMESLQRAGVLGQMSSIVAHELRQPLSTIVGYSHGLERMLDEGKMPDRDLLEEGIGAVREQAEAAERIIRKVRSYAKGKGSRREKLSALDIARRSVATVAAARITEAKLEVMAPEGDYSVYGDAMELELAVQNLVKNAAQAVRGQKDARVVVSVRRFCDERGVSRVAVEVTDNGPRLTDEQFEKLSAVLSSEKTDGLGLGLAIVSMIAENHGGRLTFERGRTGLRVSITLPAGAPAAA